MANSVALKTLNLEESFDPYRNLWRNVLIVGIEDLLKKKQIQYTFNNVKYCVEEMWLHEKDFDLICEYSQLSPKIVRKKIIQTLEKMEKKYGKKRNMSEMPGKWFHKSKGFNRESEGNHTSMSSM